MKTSTAIALAIAVAGTMVLLAPAAKSQTACHSKGVFEQNFVANGATELVRLKQHDTKDEYVIVHLRDGRWAIIDNRVVNDQEFYCLIVHGPALGTPRESGKKL